MSEAQFLPKPSENEEKENLPQEQAGNIQEVKAFRFTYPDGTIGYAESKMEAADKLREYREAQK